MFWFVEVWLCAVIRVVGLLLRPYCVVRTRLFIVVIQLFSLVSLIDRMELLGGVASLPWPAATYAHDAASWNEAQGWGAPPWWAFCGPEFDKGYGKGYGKFGAYPGKSSVKGGKGKKGKAKRPGDKVVARARSPRIW